MKLLVTGGAGYIGSATAQTLIEAGNQVTVLDNLSSGYRAAVPPEARFVQADLADRLALRELFADDAFDAILHFAASIEAGESMVNPGKFFQNNLCNTLGLIETAVQAGVRRFVLSSTAAVFASSDEPLSEESPLGPNNVYGHTKLMIEQALEWYRQIHGLHFAALRYFNAAGALPGRGEAHRPESHLIPLVLQAALGKRESISIFGADYPTPDGTCIRDYIHIRDLVSAHLLALDALEQRDRLIYNLGNGAGYSVRQVIEAAQEASGRPIKVVEAPRRPGDAARLVASSARIRAELRWAPQTPKLADIVASAWEWHRSHPNGYEG